MGFKTFIKNVKYLSKYNIKEINLSSLNMKEIIAFDQKLYENDISIVYHPKIKTIEETIQEIQNTNISIARFGDGEFAILEKQDIPFQNYDEKLEKRLKEILVSNDENIAIGINYAYFNKLDPNYTIPLITFIKNIIPSKRRTYLTHINLDKTYYSSEFTHLYNVFVNYDFVCYYNTFKSIWNKKDIIVVGGETIFDNISYNIFDNANSFFHFKAPSRNAFYEYANILDRITKTTPKTTLIIIILGPTATVLAYDLHKAGYRALDLGHIAKSYDYFMRQVERNIENTRIFFEPD